VDSASGPASPVLAGYGRRVGSLGPGLTSESADAVRAVLRDDHRPGPGFYGTCRRCRSDLPSLCKRPGFTGPTGCPRPFFLSTWKRVHVVRGEHADPGLAADVRFGARRHREHEPARCWPPGRGGTAMAGMVSFPGGCGGPGCGPGRGLAA
jgi:hypothetical protein